MNRRKRKLDGEEVMATHIWLRSSVRKKIDFLTPPGGSVVTTIEAMAEYLFAKKMKNAKLDDCT